MATDQALRPSVHVRLRVDGSGWRLGMLEVRASMLALRARMSGDQERFLHFARKQAQFRKQAHALRFGHA